MSGLQSKAHENPKGPRAVEQEWTARSTLWRKVAPHQGAGLLREEGVCTASRARPEAEQELEEAGTLGTVLPHSEVTSSAA